MAHHRTHVTTDLGELDTLVEKTDLADWIDAEPVPALQHFREELLTLSQTGTAADAEPVADRLIDVIAALREVGDTLRDDAALPSSLEAVFSRCAQDLDAARTLVDRARSSIGDAPTPISEAARERVRQARAGRQDPPAAGPR